MITVRDSVTIVNKRGLHARASAKFVNCVTERFDHLEITVSRDGVEAAGSSILGLMMLGAAMGDTIEIAVTGEGAEGALEVLTSLVRNGFDED